MNKKVIKAAVLLVVFLVSLVGFSVVTDTEQLDLTSEMEPATLPVIYLQKEDIYINELFGYKGEMDALSIRDTITPLSKDRILPVTVQAFQNHVEGISYEVRSLDMERLLEEKQVSDYTQTDGLITTEFAIQNLLEEEVEYRLIITLECGGEEIRYYTRLICAEACYVDDTLEFALNFHNKSFSDGQSAELATFIEPNSEGDNTTLHEVNIHSSLKQVAWSDFQGEVLKEPIPALREIGSNYNAVTLNYIVTSVGDNGETEFYNVEEYYRVRYSTINNRMYLLDYKRTMNEIFRGSGDNLNKDAVLLGIRENDVAYMTNENATIVGFVQEGDLWIYNSTTNQLSLVFSFRGIEGMNDRTNHQDYDIRMIKISESGSMDFVVYGYMNRGAHEGHTGVCVYHYDSIANTIQEELFIESQESYQVLKEKWGRMFYTSADSYFYMLAEGNLYRIGLGAEQEEIVQSGLNEENCAVSEDGRYVAWRKTGEENTLIMVDLEGEIQKEVVGASGEVLKPIGFVESDFVYGVGTFIDSEKVLLNKIVILDKEQQVIKEYEKSGYYVSDAYVESSTVFLERVRKNGDSYVPVEGDAIKSHEIEAAQTVQVETIMTEEKQTQVQLAMGKELGKKKPQVLTPKEVVVEEKSIVTLENVEETGGYYVYVAGDVLLYTQDVAEAISCADENAGVVLGENQQYIWRRGRKSSISMADTVVLEQAVIMNLTSAEARCLTALLQVEEISFDVRGVLATGDAPEDILQQAMPDVEILSLKGCSLEQVLYYVGLGSLVVAYEENAQPQLLVGYDERNVVLYNPALNIVYKKGLQDAGESFASAGNVFISYLK